MGIVLGGYVFLLLHEQFDVRSENRENVIYTISQCYFRMAQILTSWHGLPLTKNVYFRSYKITTALSLPPSPSRETFFV